MAGMFDDLIPGGGAKPIKPTVAQQNATSPQRKAAMDALSRQVAETRRQYEAKLKGFGPGSLLEYLPTGSNEAFDSAAAGMSDQAQGMFRVPGLGSQDQKEFAAFIKANQPSYTNKDETIEQKLRNIEGRLIPQRRAIGLPDKAPPLNGKDDGWKIERVK